MGDSNKKQLLDFLKLESRESGRAIIISGAGIVGNLIYKILLRAGIEIECFCDSSIKLKGSLKFGKRVILTSDVSKFYDNPVIIISVVAIADVVKCLDSQGLKGWFPGAELFAEFDTAQGENWAIDYEKYAVDNVLTCQKAYLKPDNIFIRSIDIIITERCSLRCKDCSNLAQYYEQPRDVGCREIYRSVDVFCSLVDEIMDFRLIGGDVFMNQKWPEIVEYLIHKNKAKRIVLYTNGTILPKVEKLETLKNNNVVIIVSNYGKISNKISDIIHTFEAMGIRYQVLKMEDWLDCSGIKEHGRSKYEKQALFDNCCAKNMLTLSGGKLFRCPYAANAFRLKAVPLFENDYVDLFAKQHIKKGTGYLKSKIRSYLNDLNYLDTCDFCSGRPLSGKEVTPAVQINKPKKYKKYQYREIEQCQMSY